ncbi:hypothetical protein [Nostoc sp.]|uniref:hypothetical protein n=1 Tax=Nostoc sp. TaxID=1180 RepID=UPI002FF6368B
MARKQAQEQARQAQSQMERLKEDLPRREREQRIVEKRLVVRHRLVLTLILFSHRFAIAYGGCFAPSQSAFIYFNLTKGDR